MKLFGELDFELADQWIQFIEEFGWRLGNEKVDMWVSVQLTVNRLEVS